MLQDEQYDNQWYIDSACSRHMTGKIEYLKDFRELQGAGMSSSEIMILLKLKAMAK